MEIFKDYPGAAGVFVAGIFSAALSSLSSALNALSAISYEDFCKPYFGKDLSETQISYILRGSVLVFGVISVIFIYIVEHLGAVMQLTMTLSSTAGGPLFGLFVMGILMPWVTASVSEQMIKKWCIGLISNSIFREHYMEELLDYFRCVTFVSGRRRHWLLV